MELSFKYPGCKCFEVRTSDSPLNCSVEVAGIDYQNLLLPIPQKAVEPDPSMHFKSVQAFLNTGLDRVTYHLVQNIESESVNYGNIVSKPKSIIDQFIQFKSRSKLSTKDKKSMSRGLVREMSKVDDKSSLFLNISPEISICKGAQIENDIAGYLLKKKQRFGYKEIFGSIRFSDKTFSIYNTPIDISPKKVIDLHNPFSIQESKDNVEGKKKFTFSNEKVNYEFKVSEQSEYFKWIEGFEKLSNEIFPKSHNNVKETNEPISRKLTPQNSLSFNILNPGRLSVGVDDVFFGWVTQKGAVSDRKRFLVLRLLEETLNIYQDDQLWNPQITLDIKIIKVAKGWIRKEKQPDIPEYKKYTMNIPVIDNGYDTPDSSEEENIEDIDEEDDEILKSEILTEEIHYIGGDLLAEIKADKEEDSEISEEIFVIDESFALEIEEVNEGE